MKYVRYVIIALLAVPALAMLAFGPRASDDMPRDRVVVDYWEKWTGNEEAQMRQIVDEFNNTVGREKGIFVRYVSTSNITQKTLLATAAGVPPDIAGIWDNNLSQYAAMQSLEPLDDLAAEYGITEQTYKPVFWEGCRYKGKLYALISTPAAVTLHYNKRMFREKASELRAAGLDPERAPRTIQEMDAYAKVLDVVDPGGRIRTAGYLPAEPGWYLHFTQYWFGGRMWDEENERFTLTDPETVEAYEWVQSYSKRLGRSATSEFTSGLGGFNSPQSPFLSGAVAMVQQGPWMANYIYDLRPEMSTVRWSKQEEMTKPLEERLKNYDWAVAPFPTAEPGLEGVTYAGFDAMVIPKGAKHKREAFEFIAYVNRQEVMEKLCMLHCKNSPLAEVSEHFLTQHPNPYISIFEAMASSPNAFAAPKVPIYMEAMDEIRTMIQGVILLEEEPEPALQRVQRTLQIKYEDFKRKQEARQANGE